MRYFFIHENLPKAMENGMLPYGTTVRLPRFDRLPDPISRHPDMAVCNVDGTLFIHETYKEGRKLLDCLHIPYQVSKKETGSTYPHDISLNAVYQNGILFGNEPFLSEELKQFVTEKGGKLCSVRQGYTKCSTVTGGNALATADRGLYRAFRENGIDTLLLPPVKIGIETYDTGFLGGASATLDENTIGFFGDITRYEAYDALKTFYSKQGISLVSLDKTPLFDYGGAVFYDI